MPLSRNSVPDPTSSVRTRVSQSTFILVSVIRIALYSGSRTYKKLLYADSRLWIWYSCLQTHFNIHSNCHNIYDFLNIVVSSHFLSQVLYAKLYTNGGEKIITNKNRWLFLLVISVFRWQLKNLVNDNKYHIYRYSYLCLQ